MRRTPLDFVEHPAPYVGGLYRGHIAHVVDADTVDVILDLGCNHYAYQPVRLAGINAPEQKTEQGKTATRYVQRWVDDYFGSCIVATVKDREKFGRYLAVVYPSRAGDTLLRPSLNESLLDVGLAVPFMDDQINFAIFSHAIAQRIAL